METGNQICHIQELNISKLAKDIIDSFGKSWQNKIKSIWKQISVQILYGRVIIADLLRF